MATSPELGLLVDPNVLGVLQAEPGQVLHRFRLRGGEEEGLAGLRQVFHDGVHGVGKTHVQNPVCFVQNCTRGGEGSLRTDGLRVRSPKHFRSTKRHCYTLNGTETGTNLFAGSLLCICINDFHESKPFPGNLPCEKNGNRCHPKSANTTDIE